jgi:hypothetical protein
VPSAFRCQEHQTTDYGLLSLYLLVLENPVFQFFLQELSEFGINVVLIEPRTNIENNTKTAKNYKPESSPYASTVQKLFEDVQSITANSSHPRDVAEVVLKVVNTSNPNVRCPVGKDAESVLKKRAELSDMEMEKWVRESFLEKKGFIR